ncbi:MAG: methyltransferase [Mariniblastus sp.]
MDAGIYFALLRFEESALGLKTALKLDVVDRIGDKATSLGEFASMFEFTPQGARTFSNLLCALKILERASDAGGSFRLTELAQHSLGNDGSSSRKPYLSMGPSEDVTAFIEMLRGNFEDLPLYGTKSAEPTLMDTEAAREISIGLSSRARNFATPLAAAIHPHSQNVKIIADVGAGSPYVADACLKLMPNLTKAILVDQANGMQFVKEIAGEIGCDFSKLEFCEQNFFDSVPNADLYCLSNTAHDWLTDEYRAIMKNIRDSISDDGVVCIHEPILISQWQSNEEWMKALWMACYATTLFKLCHGKGTCYTREEHDAVMRSSGFEPIGAPVETNDGCTALFYEVGSRQGAWL